MNNGGFQEIEMVIKFYSDLRFRRIIYRELEIEHESSRQIQTAITLDSGVCVRPMIYRHAPKWTAEALEKFEWS